MAQIEVFFGDCHQINLTASVGENGVNLKDDVMVVQAMLKYALEERYYFRKFKFPAPTGTIDNETKKLIWEYQRYLRKNDKKISISVDGLIDRAAGDKAFGKRGFWTILSLNGHVMEMLLLRGGVGNYFQDICRRYPQLNAVLDDIPVGELDLSLEPSIQRVGTLNLGIE